MNNLQLYIGGVNAITYRYDIQKVGDIFSVRIYSVANNTHIETDAKAMRHFIAQGVIDESLMHYRLKAKSIRGFFNWLGFR